MSELLTEKTNSGHVSVSVFHFSVRFGTVSLAFPVLLRQVAALTLAVGNI